MLEYEYIFPSFPNNAVSLGCKWVFPKTVMWSCCQGISVFNFSNRNLEKCLNLSKQGYNKEAYELYKTIPAKHATTSNFLIVKYQIFRNLFDDLSSDEIVENYEELIGFNYENKGFRYSKGWEYYKIFGHDSLANKYQDSIIFLVKDEYFIRRINSFRKN